MIRFLNKIASAFDLRLVQNRLEPAPDLLAESQFMELYQMVKPFTMTSPERLFSLYQSIRYVVDNHIPGSFVECGVWKGGSSMMIAKTLQVLGAGDRELWMFDTYEGMSEPSEVDRDFSGRTAKALLNQSDKGDVNSVWCYSSLNEVMQNMGTTGYEPSRIHYIKGKVEDTIPGSLPGQIALLRLDTDWYSSTLHELNHLYPLLVSKGVLIIDDFGHWEGAKKAVLQYFREKGEHPLIHRIDDTGRIIIK